jgi:hypothetical protein
MSFTTDTITLAPIDGERLRALLAAKKVDLSILPEDHKALFPGRPLTLTALSKDLKSSAAGSQQIRQYSTLNPPKC